MKNVLDSKSNYFFGISDTFTFPKMEIYGAEWMNPKLQVTDLWFQSFYWKGLEATGQAESQEEQEVIEQEAMRSR